MCHKCITIMTSVLWEAHPDFALSCTLIWKYLNFCIDFWLTETSKEVHSELFALRAAWCWHKRNTVSDECEQERESARGKKLSKIGWMQREREGERDWSALSSWSACQSRSARPECVSTSCRLMTDCSLCQIPNTIKLPSPIPPSISLNASMHQPSRRYADLLLNLGIQNQIIPWRRLKVRGSIKMLTFLPPHPLPVSCSCYYILFLWKLGLADSNGWYQTRKNKREKGRPQGALAQAKLSTVKWQPLVWTCLSNYFPTLGSDAIWCF